jgi:5-(carboxyamino)imidazole ribonucleotide synthase
VIQDKFKQNQVFEKNGIPTPRFMAVDELTSAHLAPMRFPIVQKARKGGYDGRGVVILQGLEEIEKALKVPSVIEEFVDFTKELAVIVARNPAGETACYPVVEMVFDDRTNICDIVTAPARIDAITAARAQHIALQTVESLEGVGVFGIEMFLTREGEILVNEVAPRPHNSGHYTIEACITSQFEQLIRAISGLPLGATTLLKPVAMLNLLGEPGYSGTPRIEGLQQALAIPGVSFHLYGKEITKPFRKMGHVTVIDDDLEQAIAKIYQVKNILKIRA